MKAPPAWAVLYFSRADWHVNFSGCWYDGSRVRIPEPAAIIPQACAQHYCQRHTTGEITRNPDFPAAGVAADSGTMNDQNITIGERNGWGDSQPFGIAAIDERQHIYIIGKTGSGKTTLLRNLILQHIALGHGVGVIDPHGDLAEELLNCN